MAFFLIAILALILYIYEESYEEGGRRMSKVTIPIKNNLEETQGAIILRVSEIAPLTNMHLITLGDLSFEVSYDKGFYHLYGRHAYRKTDEVMFIENNIEVVISWSEDAFWASVYSVDAIPKLLGTLESFVVSNAFGEHFSLFERNYLDGIYEYLEIYTEPLSQNNLGAFSLPSFKGTAQRLFVADFSKESTYGQEVILEDTFAPRDNSPVLISDDYGPMYRQFLFDEETGEYTNRVEETFVYRGGKCENLSYWNIDGENAPTITVKDDIDLLYPEDFVIKNSQVVFRLTNQKKEYYYGKEMTVTYELERSYNIEFNEDTPHDGYRVNLSNIKAYRDNDYMNSTEQIRVAREGDSSSGKYLAKEIELNPMVNTQVQGFMYIDKTYQYVQDFLISTSNQYLSANGVDSANIIIEAMDKEKNPVLSPYLYLRVMDKNGKTLKDFGGIEPVIDYQTLKSRSTSGQVHYRFTAPVIVEDVPKTHEYFILLYDRYTGVGAQYPIYIKSVLPHQVIRNKKKTNQYTEVPFEYVARFFERELTEDNPLNIFDRNRNKRLDLEDLEYFKELSKDKDLMIFVTVELIKWELDRLSGDNIWEEFGDDTWEDHAYTTWLQMSNIYFPEEGQNKPSVEQRWTDCRDGVLRTYEL